MRFLSYEVDLVTTEIRDELKGKKLVDEREAEVLWILLEHYSRATPRGRTGRLISFRNLPGGCAYNETFLQRAVQPISEQFGREPKKLVVTGEMLGGVVRTYGDFAIEISPLPMIPLTYILWAEDEFPATANILFDESASQYLPTEDLAVLAQITTFRMQEARSSL